MTEFNLSERMGDWTASQTENVKEFIRILKEALNVPPLDKYTHYIEKKIDKLAGEKLK